MLEWSLEVAVPDCPDAVFEGKICELAYSVTFSRDEAGYSSRTLAGHIRIALTRQRQGSDKFADSADAYREKLNPPIPEGYRRKWGPFKLDEAKTRLDFEFTDEEMPANVPPPGVISATASHSVSSSVKGLRSWTSTLTASYTLEKNADPVEAVRAFLALLRSRVARLAAALTREPAGDASKSLIAVAFTMSEPEVYEATQVNLSLTYIFTGGLATVLGNSGLWLPVPGSDWKKWSASLADGFHHPRASARLTFTPGDDRLVDLCDPAEAKDLLPATTDLTQAQLPNGPGDDIRTNLEIAKPQFADLISRTFPKPKQASSWVAYECQIYVEMDSGTVPLRTLPAAPLTAKSDLMSKADDFSGRSWDAELGTLPKDVPADTKPTPAPTTPSPLLVGGRLDNTPAPTGGKSPPVAAVQRRVAPFCYVYLRGRATRAGFQIPIPSLLDIDGVTPVPANRLDAGEGYTQTVAFDAGGSPLYNARWNLRYFLPTTPTKMPTPPNPLLDAGR